MKLIISLIALFFTTCEKNNPSSSENDNSSPSNDEGYTVMINSTGISHLVVFLDSIQGLEAGDEIGVFDLNGVVATDSTGLAPEYGEVLVGMATWNQEANAQGTVASCSAIMSEDLSEFGGPILNGAVDGNDIIFRVYDVSENVEYNTSASFQNGGQFGDIFTTVSTIEIEE